MNKFFDPDKMSYDKMNFNDAGEPTFFFYDLETSGLDPKNDRIMQFAGIRTDLNFNQIGEPINLLVKLSDDTLPSPQAIMVTGITPQSTLLDGLSEPEFCKYVQDEIFTPGTIEVGYNSVRFDDEHMRYTFYRNFYDPYEWQWKDGRSRWDLLDVVRLTRALRPEGINWPVAKIETVADDGETKTTYKPTNRLELITKENGIVHKHAHDALSDVEALISVTKLIAEKQPNLYNYLFKMRNKNEIKRLVNLDNKQPFVYASGHYSSKNMHTTIAFPLTAGTNGNVVVFDLRYNLNELLKAEVEFVPEEKIYNGKKYMTKFNWKSAVKELAYNKCPAVAPLSVLDVVSNEDSGDLANPSKAGASGWDKIGLSREQVDENLKILISHPEFAEKMREYFEKYKESFGKADDVDAKLYDGFMPDSDKVKLKDVRSRNENELADYEPIFNDPRLSELLLRYKGRNFPRALNENEMKEYEKYRTSRLQKQEKSFVTELEMLKSLSMSGKPMKNGKMVDESLLEDLYLWYQSLANHDF
jgi:exodeoxyribonuclease-1